jgi:poly(ribitol-phosphate) beta-N-acetylglucosaminyltransferase
MKFMSTFSIIIPVFNSENTIMQCVDSVLDQNYSHKNIEIIIIDDCSTDNTNYILNYLAENHKGLIKCLKTSENAGPGNARNIGIDNSNNEWILFLDSDDILDPYALKKLASISNVNDFQIIGYDWSLNTECEDKVGQRNDFSNLLKCRNERFLDSLALRMDGSVIFTLFRKDFINNNDLRFFDGFHEDVDFIFKTYFIAENVGILNEVIYIKSHRPNSIVNSISIKHLDGYFRAYLEIYNFISQSTKNNSRWKDHFSIGLAGIVATRLRDIINSKLIENEKLQLLKCLHRKWIEISSITSAPMPVKHLNSRHGLIAKYFFKIMDIDNVNKNTNIVNSTSDYIQKVGKRTWSCYDLHNSAFLAPNEIRTCCKRFFVNGQMKGDVALVKPDQDGKIKVSKKEILDKKKDLHKRLNTGEETECDGCPFLEFKEWEQFDKLKLEHLSLEYHSMCNMRCSYCSETYYGGDKPKYDVFTLLEELSDDNCLEGCNSVVFGGGEPTLDKSFEKITNLLVNDLPKSTPRVLTNAVKYSPALENFIKKGQVSILTSIDAGTDYVFRKVRGINRLDNVLTNLSSYAKQNSNNVSLKYIFTDENSDIKEILALVEQLKKFNLLHCSFQISYNFKDEDVRLESLISIVVLYGLLVKENCSLVYLDELLRQRLKFFASNNEYRNKLWENLIKTGYDNLLESPDNYESVSIWGAGYLTKLLLKNSWFFNNVKVSKIIDSNPALQGKYFVGYPVVAPESLLEDNESVFLSAVQNTPVLYKNYIKLGLQEDRLIKGLIL